jgi:hypothetical protein
VIALRARQVSHRFPLGGSPFRAKRLQRKPGGFELKPGRSAGVGKWNARSHHRKESSMRFSHRPFLLRRALLLSLVLVAGATVWAVSADESAFMAENDAAMKKMMAAMQVKPSGDVDKDFVAMMAAHHQGAIDMARTELRYGHNEQLRRIAQEIIASQQQEIPAMWLAIGRTPPPSVPSPAGAPSPSNPSMHMPAKP